MWFSIYDFPVFFTQHSNGTLMWDQVFKSLGFNTFKVDRKTSFLDKRHWLDRDEFNIFVLRYS